MSDRYWVGGTANWDATAGTKWATTDGGAGGAAVPTSSDDVYFTAASGTVTVTISTGPYIGSLNCTGFTGTLTGSANINVYGDVTLSTTMAALGTNLAVYLLGTGNSNLTTNGKSIPYFTTQKTGAGVSNLMDALTVAIGSLNITSGTFSTNNYNVTASSLSSSNSNTRTINLGSSTVTLSSSNSVNFLTNTNLVFNAGTSNIRLSNASGEISGGATGVTFYDVSWITSPVSPTLNGSNSFNNLTMAGCTSAGVAVFAITANQTINGTLTLSAGTNATCRTFVRSNTIGTTRTLTCAAIASLTDIDFRDITIAGAAAPVSGTRLGDCKGNSGITFDAAKTVYWRNSSGANWGSTTWSLTDGGSYDTGAFPLAQDTAVIGANYPNSGQTVTVNAAYNIGTIDMSARTSNTMSLACSQQISVYGNWINGTGTTLSGSGVMTFAGRGSQTITSAGKTFTQRITTDSPSGSVTIQDALIISLSSSSALNHLSGTFDANGYNVTISGTSGGVASGGTASRTLGISSGTWTLAGTGGWNISGSNLAVTGTGTISLTSVAARTFAGGGIQTYPTLNQGGTGTLTVTGSNKFADITNTAIGRVQFQGGTTNEFTAFNLNGVSGNLLQVGSSNTTQVTLKAPSWNVGANSTDAGNNTGLTFSAGSVDYLSISYVNGEITAAPTILAYISELTTATDSAAVTSRVTNPTISEAAQMADALSGGLLFLSDISEATTASEIAESVLIFNRAVVEATTASEVLAAIAVFQAAVPEQVSGADVANALLTVGGAINEALTALDEVVAANNITANVGALGQNMAQLPVGTSAAGSVIFDDTSFTGTAAIFANGTGTGSTGGFNLGGNYFGYSGGFGGAFTPYVDWGDVTHVRIELIAGTGTNGGPEPAASFEVGMQAVFGMFITSTMIATITKDAATTLISVVAQIPDDFRYRVASFSFRAASATTSSTPSWGVKNITFYFGGGSAADSTTNVYTANPVIAETAIPLDAAQVVASTFSAAAAETAIPLDTPQGANTGSSSLSESAAISDAAATAFVPSTAISESSTAQESASSLAVLSGPIVEAAALADTTSVAPSVFSAVALAAAQAAESFNPAGSVYNASAAVSVVAVDALRRSKLRVVDIEAFVSTGANVTVLSAEATVTGNTASGTVESGQITATVLP